jgi:hypothetical protein
MSNTKIDQLVENFFNSSVKQAQEVELLNEATLDTNDIAKMKYFIPFVDKISKGEQLFLEPKNIEEEPVYFTVDTASEEGKQFLQALIDTSADKAKLDALFKKGARMIPVIPSMDGNKYSLNQLGKVIFTTKVTKGGLQGTETPDMKEGLVSYFFLVGSSGIEQAENKLKSKSDVVLELPTQIIDPVYFAKKSAGLVKNAITYLNENQIKDKKEIGLYLNAISAAKTCLTFDMNVVDRGNLFEMIRKIASNITMIEPDKWCPGDIYLYDADSKNTIQEILKAASENKNIVSIVEDGEIKQIGVNQLFEGDSPLIHAISLKEEEALSGRATAFLNVKNIQGKELSSKTFKFEPEEINILKIYKDRTIPNADELIEKYKQSYQENKQAFKSSISSYGVQVVEGVGKKAQKIKSPEQELGNLVSKSTCYRFMSSYLNDFDNLKQTNEIMVKYDNPMLALTAFGVSLSGFNPTFKKVVAFADGNPASVTVFKGRDSLNVAANEAFLFDSPTKAGFNFSFLTLMGEKKYKTTLDIRFAGGLSISIIVEEFHEE